MSEIYSIFGKIIRFVQTTFRKSLLFTTIFNIFRFIENAWVSSFITRLYPKNTFLSFMNKNKIISNYLFSPLILLVVFAIFLSLSIERISFELIITLAIGFIASQSIVGQEWVLNPLELVFYRAAFTLKVFDHIIPLASSTGGYILSMIFSSGSPRTFIGEYVLNYHVLVTSTLFGPVFLDFGIIGLSIQMLFFGTFLKLIHLLQKNIKGLAIGIYSIILAHTLIWIETGPTDLMIWLLFVLGFILIIFNYKNMKFIFKKN